MECGQSSVIYGKLTCDNRFRIRKVRQNVIQYYIAPSPERVTPVTLGKRQDNKINKK